MRIALSHSLPRNRANAGETIPVAASFYNDADPPVLTAPTTIRWRLDDPDTGSNIIDWTTVSPATTATISIPGTSTETQYSQESRRVLTVEGNHDLSTQCRKTLRYFVDAMAFCE